MVGARSSEKKRWEEEDEGRGDFRSLALFTRLQMNEPCPVKGRGGWSITHSRAEELPHDLESCDGNLVVEERGGELKEGEGET